MMLTKREYNFTAWLAIIVAIVAQAVFHWAIGLDNVVSVFVREWYLYSVGNTHLRHHAPVAWLVESVIPGFGVGFVFGAYVRGGNRVLILFSVLFALCMAGLQVSYPIWVGYDIWWFGPEQNPDIDLFIDDVVSNFAFCGGAALVYRSAKKREQEQQGK